MNGQHGTAATPNTISLVSVPNQNIFVVSTYCEREMAKEEKECSSGGGQGDVDVISASILPLYDGKVSINLSAMGGAGGRGGNGGRGE